MNFKGDDIHVPAQDMYEIQTFLDGGVLTIYDHPWPGFTPDLLSIVLVVATQAKGSVLIHKKCSKAACSLLISLLTWAPRSFCATRTAQL